MKRTYRHESGLSAVLVVGEHAVSVSILAPDGSVTPYEFVAESEAKALEWAKLTFRWLILTERWLEATAGMIDDGMRAELSRGVTKRRLAG